MTRSILCSICLFAFGLMGCSSASPVDDGAASNSEDLSKAALCGGPFGLSCPKGSYCRGPLGSCPSKAQVGVCTARPQLCPDIYMPVCGCDGHTYPNACNAAAAGVSVSSQGACPKPERVFCGGIANIQCPGAGTCVDDPDDNCDPKNGGNDCGGICTCIQKVLCIKGTVFDPSPSVCACVATE